MTCNIDAIKKTFEDNGVVLSQLSAEQRKNLNQLMILFSDKGATVQQRQAALNKVLSTTFDARERLLNKAFNDKPPIDLKLEFTPITISDTDLNNILRRSRNAAQNILRNTIEIGVEKLRLRDFVNATTGKLSLLFNISQTIEEWTNSTDGKDFIASASDAAKNSLRFMVVSSRKLNTWFYEGAEGKPIHIFMNKTKQKFFIQNGINNTKDSVTDHFKWLFQGDPKTGDLDVDPMVLEAVNQAIFNWRTTISSETDYNDDADINRIFGRDSRDKLTRAQIKNFRRIGSVQATVIESIGKEAVRNLGIKAKKDVDGTFHQKLEIALGELAVAYMLDTGIVKQNSAPNAWFPKDNGKDSESGQDSSANETLFIRVIDVGNERLHAKNRKEAKDLTEKLGLETYKTFPRQRPIEKVDEFMKRTRQRITAATAKVIKKLQNDPWKIKTEIVDSLFTFSEETQRKILGFNDELDKVHKTQRSKAEADNNRLQKTLDDFNEFRSNLKNENFFLKYFVAKTGRIFVDNNTIDPVQNKTVRHLVGLKSYNVTVPDVTEDFTVRTQFMLAVVQAFDLKPGIDKQSLDSSIDQFESLLKNKQAAIDSIKSGKPDEALILKALNGGGIAAYEGLMALVKYHPTEAFETNIAIETDAVTSGVAIGMLQSFLDGDLDFESIGVFPGATGQDFPSWKGQTGNFDLYEKLTQLWAEKITEAAHTGKDGAKYRAVRSLVGSFTSDGGLINKIGRNYAKYPLMITNYGGSVASSMQGFSTEVLEKFYSQLAEAKDRDAELEVIKKASDIIGREIKYPEDAIATEFELTYAQENAFVRTVYSTYGIQLQAALEERLGSFMRYRETINASFQSMFAVFEQLFVDRVNQLEKTLDRPLSVEETEQVMDDLQRYMPIAKGPLSKGIKDGLLVIKGGLRRQYDQAHQAQQQYARKLNNTAKTDKFKDGRASLNSYSKNHSFNAPGVAGTVVNIHNLDSAIQQAMLSTVSALNIHDAGMYPLDQAVEGTAKYNEAFFEMNMQFNIAETVLKAYNDMVARIESLPDGQRQAVKTNIIKHHDKTKFTTIHGEKLDYSPALHRQIFEEMVNTIENNRQEFLDKYEHITVSHSAHTVDTTHTVTNKVAREGTLGQQLVSEIIDILGPGQTNPVRQKVKAVVTDVLDQQLNLGLSGTNPDDFTPIKKDIYRFWERQAIESNIADIENTLATLLKTSNTVAQFISLAGGLNRTTFKSQGIDPQSFKMKQVVFGRPVFPKEGGLTPDGLAEIFNEEQFRGKSNHDAHDAVEIVFEMLEDTSAELIDINDNTAFQALKEELAFQEENLSVLVEEVNNAVDNVNELGSATRSVDYKNFQALFTDTITAESMQTIFDTLASFGNKKDSAEHTARLQELMTNLIKIQNSIDLKVGETDAETFGTQRTLKDGSQDIHILGSTSTIKNNAALSAQEVYVHEMIHAITEAAIDTNAPMRRVLKRLYEQAKKEFTWRDFLPEGKSTWTAEEVRTAKETYDYVFNNTKVSTVKHTDPNSKHKSFKHTNPYLHEFVAYGLTNERMAKKLATLTVKAEKRVEGDNLYESILNWLGQAIEYLSNRILGIDGLSADVALRKLVDQMTSTTEKNQWKIFKLTEALNINETFARKINDWILSPLVEFSRSERPKHVPGRVLRTVATIADSERYAPMGKVINQVAKNLGIAERGFMTKLVREIQGLKDNNAAWHAMVRVSKKVVDQARLHTTENVIKQIKEGFHNQNLLTRENKAAIYKTIMKTDIAALMDSFNEYSPAQIIGFMQDKDTLAAAITKVENQLLSREFGDNSWYYVNQARGLGNLMTIGADFKRGQMQNAYLIANLQNTKNTPTGDLRKAEQLIEELSTLHALQNVDMDSRRAAANVWMEENAVDGEQNGIVKTLYLHNLNKQMSLEKLFEGNKALVQKGYTRETYNPSTDIKVVTKDLHTITEKGKQITINTIELMQREGYMLVDPDGKPMPSDPLDTGAGPRYLMVHKNAVNAEWVKSIVSLTNKKARGTSIEDIYMRINEDTGYYDAKDAVKSINNETASAIKKQFKKNDPTTSMLLPIVNEQGQTKTYRYVLSEHTKDTLMERDNRFDYAMGRMFGSITDKVNSKQVNDQVVKLAFKDFKDNFESNPSLFVDIGPRTRDKELKEIYELLPKDMKETMREVWGKGKPLYVREEFVNLIFGFRKMSIKDADNMAGAAVRGVNDSITWVMRNTFFPEAPNADVGRIWEEFVDIVKELIVVKTGVIMLPNFISNTILLAVKGVGMKNLFLYQKEAIVELDQYRKDVSRRDIIKRELVANKKLGAKQKERLALEFAKLQDDISNNPVSQLIDEGIFQSIIEDVDFEEDIYSTKVKLADKAEKLVSKHLPGYLTSVYKHLYLSKDTEPYKILLKITQMSDFIARYSLYKHRMVNQPKDADPKQYYNNVIDEIVGNFVNYDLPTSKEMQKVNDVGFAMFTKFYFRIPKYVFRLFTGDDKPGTDKDKVERSRAASMIALYGIEQMMGNVEDVSDTILRSSFLNRLNTPFDLLDTGTVIPAWELIT